MLHAMQTSDAHAMIRFGFGPRAGESPVPDPKTWLAAQVRGPDPARFPATLPSTADGLVMLREQRRLRPPPGASLVRPLLQAEQAAQLRLLLDGPAPFRERLVWFWANHFTVSTRKAATVPLAGAFVREAIRPNVNRRFVDMLLAVMRHPAMLLYLDNAGSVGPHSPAGLRRGRGLNENLARECLELHTLGARAGYSQTDVTSFAAILTGWSVDMRSPEPGFIFRAGAHEPGDKAVLGRIFPEGEAGGVLAIGFLASHPATCRHLAGKLATHFIADTPAPAQIDRLAGILADSQGDLEAVSLALLDMSQAWQPGSKFRTPLDYAVAILRALGAGGGADAGGGGGAAAAEAGRGDAAWALAALLRRLGQPVWQAPLPDGWADSAAAWSGPDAVLARIDASYELSGGAPPDLEPAAIAAASLGPLLSPRTLAAMRQAGSRRDALTLLFSSPEFQRR